MRVMVLVQTDPAREETYFQEPNAEAEMAAMNRFNEELLKAGVMLAGEGLTPSSQGKRITFGDDGTSIVDGPFTETKELVGGYWIWEVESMEEAVEWVKRGPFQDGTLELRRIYEEAEFADGFPQPNK